MNHFFKIIKILSFMLSTAYNKLITAKCKVTAVLN
jgi:hypothetical protein